MPAAPSEAVYSVSASFSGAGCAGALMNSSITLENGAGSSNSYYYSSYQSITTCTAPANGTCKGYNFHACPTAGLSFATIVGRPVAPVVNMSSYTPTNNKVLFQNNVCRGHKQGGTVFFVKDPQAATQLFGPQMTYYNQRIVFVNNTAAVGRAISTQTTSLRNKSNHTTIVVTDYNLFLHPSPVFNLVDAFNNINSTDFATTVSVLRPYPILPYPTISLF